MKKLILFVVFVAWAGVVHAQAVGEIKDVLIDEARGSIIVQTEYKVNGQVVDVDGTVCTLKDGKYYINVLALCENSTPKLSEQMYNLDNSKCELFQGKYYASVWKECIGQSRYTEESGKDNAEIIAKAKEDVATHAENLIRRITANSAYLQTKMLETQKNLTTPIKDAIRADLIGQKITKTEAVTNFKGKEIKVTYDQKNSISDISAVTP